VSAPARAGQLASVDVQDIWRVFPHRIRDQRGGRAVGEPSVHQPTTRREQGSIAAA